MVFVTVAQKGDFVFVRFDNAPSCMGDVTGYLDKIHEIYKVGKPFVIIYDATNIAMLERKYIQKQIEFMKAQVEQTKDLMIRAAVVVNGPIMSAFLQTAVFLVQPPACELKVVNRLKDAQQFVGCLLDPDTKKLPPIRK